MKNSKLKAVLSGDCPRCRKGKLFKSPPYNYFRFDQMNEYCSCCHLRFVIEPGFYYGAMYVSYAFSIAIVVVFGFLTSFIFDHPSVKLTMLVVGIVTLVLIPISFQYSRILMLHLFGGINYDPDIECLKAS